MEKINTTPRLITPEEIEKLATAIVLDLNELTDTVNTVMKNMAKRLADEKPMYFPRSENNQIEDFVAEKLTNALVIELPDHDYNLVHRLHIEYGDKNRDERDKGKVDIMSDTYVVSKDWKVAIEVTQFAELGGGMGEMSVIGNSIKEVVERKDEYILRDMEKCKELNSKKK